MAKKSGLRAQQAEKTRLALIRAARALFAAKGYHATGTPEIVRAANVTRGALYHHFPHKEDLFLAVFEDVQLDLVARAGEAAKQGGEPNAWLRFQDEFKGFLQAAAHPEIQRILLLDGPAVLGWSEWRRLEVRYGLGLILNAVTAGLDSGLIRAQPAEPLAHLILSIIDEAAIMIANAQNPQVAIAEAERAIETLLGNLS